MKKAAMLVACAVFLMMCAGCGKTEAPEHYGVEAKTIGFDTLQEMEDYVDLIVKVVRTGEETPVLRYEDGVMYSGFTFSQVEVKEVYASSADPVEVGDTIRILENEVFAEEENVVYHIAGYNMMEEGKEYLLFVNQRTYSDGETYYVAAGVNFGTVSLEEDGRNKTRASRNGDVVSDLKVFEPIWDAAREKYAG